MNEKEICPICGDGHLTDHVDQVDAEYNGHTGKVPLLYQLCDLCMSDSAGAVQMRANKRGMVAFRKPIKYMAQEPKPVQAPASPRDSSELRAKLAESQLTPADVAAAVDWARVNAPSA
jgi:hypothetical protein